MKVNLIEKLKQNKVYPIIRKTNVQDIKDMTEILIDAGLDVIEITVENPKVYEIIQKYSKEAIICAGGIITSIQAQVAIDSGARIISSPIFSKNLVKISKDRQIPLISGTSTANEAYEAWKARVPIVKVYPAAALGGAEYIENMLRPMPFLNIIPQGNVKPEDVKKYIDAGAIAVGIGRNLTGLNKHETQTTIKKLLESLK